MAARDIIVVGASAGGVEALQELVRTLPEKFSGSIFITVHFPQHGTSVLPRILSRAGRLPALNPADGEAIIPGRIYVARPNFHLMLGRHAIHLVRGPRENGNRPAIDPMFRSAANAFGPRVIGVVLTGNLDDGTSGLAAIKRHGGLTVVQDPKEALFSSMPQSAMDHVDIDRVAPLREITSVVLELMSVPIQEGATPIMRDDQAEEQLSAGNLDTIERPEQHPGSVSAFSCPDCGGVLWELREGEFVRFRCRVGHGWTGDALVAKQLDVLDDALWTALRSLEENVSLSQQLAKRNRDRGFERVANRFERNAVAMEARAQIIRAAIAQESESEPLEERASARAAGD
jgi:two-component system chemotaxis response regulator CheB